MLLYIKGNEMHICCETFMLLALEQLRFFYSTTPVVSAREPKLIDFLTGMQWSQKCYLLEKLLNLRQRERKQQNNSLNYNKTLVTNIHYSFLATKHFRCILIVNFQHKAVKEWDWASLALALVRCICSKYNSAKLFFSLSKV